MASQKPIDPQELGRRSAASKKPLVETSIDPTAIIPDLQLDDPSQSCFIISIANKESSPISEKPFINIMGAFPSVEKALEWANVIIPMVPHLSLRIVSSYGWLLVDKLYTTEENKENVDFMRYCHHKAVCKSTEQFKERHAKIEGPNLESSMAAYNPAYEQSSKYMSELSQEQEAVFQQKVAEQFEEAQVYIKQQREEVKSELEVQGELKYDFEKKNDLRDEIREEIEQKRIASIGFKQLQMERQPESKEDKETVLSLTRAEIVGKTVEVDSKLAFGESVHVPNQRYCLLSSMNFGDMYAIYFHGVVGSVEEAKGFEYTHLRRVHPGDAIHCVDMYSWIAVKSMDGMCSSNIARYRMDEQDRIMLARSSQSEVVANYIRSARDAGYEVPEVKEIEADLA